MIIILIPVYNDWASLNKLLKLIDITIATKIFTKVLIIDDCSTIKLNLRKEKLKKINNVEVLKLNKNLGSQKAITVGLSHLKKYKDKFYTVIMDGDGEDDPGEIEKMLRIVFKNKDSVAVSCRSGRNDSFFIQCCYKFHLLICFFFTAKWLNFGHYSCFYSKNLSKILTDNTIWYAYPSSILKNIKIIRTYARRKKRFFGKTKMHFVNYAEHSLRVISVFSKRVMIFSLFYSFLIFKLFDELFLATTFLLLLFNIFIYSVVVRHKNHYKHYTQLYKVSKL